MHVVQFSIDLVNCWAKTNSSNHGNCLQEPKTNSSSCLLFKNQRQTAVTAYFQYQRQTAWFQVRDVAKLKQFETLKKKWKWVGPGPFWMENGKLENQNKKLKSLMIIYFWVIL